MKTLGQILKLSYEYISKKSSSHSRHEVDELIAHCLGKKRLDLYLNFDKPLNEVELDLIRKNLTRLAANEPLQYIEGTVQFYGCTIKVDKRVLIPRPETELLVDHIAKTIGPDSDKTLWDICTGSGCIGIALKRAIPGLKVTLSDISKDALDLARENAALNGVEVTLVQGDLLEPFKGQKTDYIVCNPPYISEAEYGSLEPHVRDYEPKLALVGGKTGLECYDRLIPAISPGTSVWLEIGALQGAHFPDAKIIQDLSHQDRFVEFIKR